jgi:hypothetical protein
MDLAKSAVNSGARWVVQNAQGTAIQIDVYLNGIAALGGRSRGAGIVTKRLTNAAQQAGRGNTPATGIAEVE